MTEQELLQLSQEQDLRNNPELPAANYRLPDTSSVSYLSTKNGERIANFDAEKIKEIQAGLAASAETVRRLKGSYRPQTVASETQSQGLTREEAMALFKTPQGTVDFTGVHYDEKTGLFFPDSSAYQRLQAPSYGSTQFDQTADMDTQISFINSQFAALQERADMATANLIASIRQQYEARKEQMKDINNRTKALQQTIGIRLGTGRYAPTIAADIISAEERAGAMRLSEIDAQEAAAVAAAVDAQRKNDFTMLHDKLGFIEKAREEKQKILEKQQALMVEKNKEIQKQADVVRQRELQARRDTAIVNTISEIDSVNAGDILRTLNARGGNFTFDEINKITKEFKVAEKSAQGIVGEWLAAKENDPTLQGVSLMNYIAMKNPTLALDIEQQKLQIAKLEKELAESGNKGIANEDPMNLLAYAQQYASTGQIPTGLPKGSFGIIASTAKELPKQEGAIVNRLTGIVDAKTPSVEQQDYSRLYNIINNTKRLKQLDQERVAGLSGILARTFSRTQQEKTSTYLTLRNTIIDDMQRMQSGAALTPDEITFYSDYIPGKYGEALQIGPETSVKINNFEQFINNRLVERLNNNNLAIYGYSKVKIGNKEYTVGDTVTNANGQQGRVLPDGSISIE